MTDNQKMYAMYVIGEVESNWNWASVNYNDPITIGMMQWYGTRAAELLNRCRNEDSAGYAMLSTSLRQKVESVPWESSAWNGTYLTRDEGSSWANIATRAENHSIQQDQFINDDIPAYIKTLTSWGITEDNVKTMIFCMSMYHQGPKYCGQVIATVGNSDLDTMWRTCLNNAVLGKYANRYNTVHSRLASWDGESAPPDFGQTTTPGSSNPGGDAGGNGGVVTQQTGITAIREDGDHLIIYGQDFPNGLLAVRNVGREWIPAENSAKAPPTGGTGTPGGGSGGGTPSDEITRMFKLWAANEKKWAYGQGAGRLNPPQSGYSDCSGCIWWAINSIDPDKAKNIGTWTGAMVSNGTEIGRGTDCANLPLDKMIPGDIILLEWGYENYAFNDGNSHVEWYTGNNNT